MALPSLTMQEIRLADLIPETLILSDMTATTKEGALLEMSKMLSGAVGEDLQVPILEALSQRERLASTGIGEQVAIPHGKLDQLPYIVAGLARSRAGIDFGAIDGQRTHLFFAIVAPGGANGMHLRALARIARCCRNDAFRTRLLKADETAEMYDVLRSEDL